MVKFKYFFQSLKILHYMVHMYLAECCGCIFVFHFYPMHFKCYLLLRSTFHNCGMLTRYFFYYLSTFSNIFILFSSVVNGFLVCGISFRFGRKNEIRKEYLGTGYSRSYYFRLSNGWYFIKTTKNIHILLNISHFYFILSKSHDYIRFNISESHFQLQVLVHVRPARNNHCQ